MPCRIRCERAYSRQFPQLLVLAAKLLLISEAKLGLHKTEIIQLIIRLFRRITVENRRRQVHTEGPTQPEPVFDPTNRSLNVLKSDTSPGVPNYVQETNM